MSSKVPTLMKCKEVQTTLTISRATIYRWMDAGTFPRPIQLGAHMVRWKRSDINNWLTEKGGFLDERGHPNFCENYVIAKITRQLTKVHVL